jgi:dCTP deaminase
METDMILDMVIGTGILSDLEIRELCEKGGMIDPYVPELVSVVEGKKVISYGQSSFGYDIRAGEEWYIMDDSELMVKVVSKDSPILIPPRSFALTHSVERFKIPKDVIGVAVGKSTYARAGLIVNITPLEPGWEGWLTVEVINPSPHYLKVYPYEGIAQILFFRGRTPKEVYDSNRKYQNQERKVVFPKVIEIVKLNSQ